MLKVNEDLLRRFYGQMWHGRLRAEELYAGATFDEYYALQRIRYPDITKHTAAMTSPIAVFKELAADFPNVPPPSRELRTHAEGRVAKVVLNDCDIPADTQRIIVSRVKSVSGLEALAALKQLRALHAVLSQAPARVALAKPIAIDSVDISSCNMALVQTLLASTRAKKLVVGHNADAVLDISSLAAHGKLADLSAGAPFLRGVDALAKLPITQLGLGGAPVDDALHTGLLGISKTLRSLRLATLGPVEPAALPELADLPKLERFELTLFPGQSEAWLDFAVAHPQIGFRFGKVKPDPKREQVSVEDLHGGVAILRIAKGKKTSFEVSGDLAVDFGCDDNDELETAARKLARKAKKKIQWSSEADTFVARCKTADDCRWLIDAMGELR